MDKIFFIETEKKFNLFHFRLEIFSSNGGQLVDPEYLELPKESVNLDSISWSFDKIPMGINSDITQEVEWYIDSLPEEFMNILLHPRSDKLFVIDDYNSIDYRAGNIYELYIVREGVPTIIYRGVQLSDMKHNLSIKNKTFKATLEGLGHFILTRIDLMKFLVLNGGIYGATQSSPCIYEFFRNLGSGSVIDMSIQIFRDIKTQQKHSDYFVFSSYEQLEYTVQTMYQNIYNNIMRTGGFSQPTVELPFMKYYKRHATGGHGSELSKSEVKLLSHVKINENVVGGLFSPDPDGLARYSVMYDFLSDLAQESYCKLFISPTGEFVSVYPFTSTDEIVIPYNVIEAEVENYSINQLTVSLSEFDDKDVESYEFKEAAIRNGEDYPIPLVFNNTSPNNVVENVLSDSCPNISDVIALEGGTAYIKYSKGPARMWNLYYFDMPEGLREERAFKVDEYCETRGGFRLLSVPGVRPSDIQNPLVAQREYGKPLMFKSLLDLIGYDNAVSLKIKVDLEFINLETYWFGADKRFYLDLTNYSQYYAGYTPYFYLTKSTIDIQDETMTCEFIGF